MPPTHVSTGSCRCSPSVDAVVARANSQPITTMSEPVAAISRNSQQTSWVRLSSTAVPRSVSSVSTR